MSKSKTKSSIYFELNNTFDGISWSFSEKNLYNISNL
jgi:hypothetical protein